MRSTNKVYVHTLLKILDLPMEFSIGIYTHSPSALILLTGSWIEIIRQKNSRQ